MLFSVLFYYQVLLIRLKENRLTAYRSTLLLLWRENNSKIPDMAPRKRKD